MSLIITLIIVAVLTACIAYYFTVVNQKKKKPAVIQKQVEAAPTAAKPKSSKVDITKKNASTSSSAASSASRPRADSGANEHTGGNDHPLVFRHLRGHQGDITSIAVGPSGRHIASVATDEQLRLWTIVDSEKNTHFARHNLKKGEHASAVDISADDTYVVIAIASTKQVQIFGIKDKANQAFLTPLHSFPTPHKFSITSLKMAANSQFIITLAEGLDLNLHVWGVKGGLIATLPVSQILNYTACISSDSRFITAGTKISDTKVWEVLSKKGSLVATPPEKIELALTLKGQKRGIKSLAFGEPSTGLLVTASLDGSFFIHSINVRYDVREDAKLKWRTVSEFSSIDLIDITSNPASESNQIAISSGSSLQFWSVPSSDSSDGPQLLASIPAAHKGNITSLHFNKSGNKTCLVTAGSNKSITIWDLPKQ